MAITPIDFGVELMNPGPLPSEHPGSDPFQGILDTILQTAIRDGIGGFLDQNPTDTEGFTPDFIFDPDDPITSALFGGTMIDEYR